MKEISIGLVRRDLVVSRLSSKRGWIMDQAPYLCADSKSEICALQSCSRWSKAWNWLMDSFQSISGSRKKYWLLGSHFMTSLPEAGVEVTISKFKELQIHGLPSNLFFLPTALLSTTPHRNRLLLLRPLCLEPPPRLSYLSISAELTTGNGSHVAFAPKSQTEASIYYIPWRAQKSLHHQLQNVSTSVLSTFMFLRIHVAKLVSGSDWLFAETQIKMVLSLIEGGGGDEFLAKLAIPLLPQI